MSIIYLKDQHGGSEKPKDMRSAVHEYEIDGFNQKLVIGHLNRLYEFIGGSFHSNEEEGVPRLTALAG